MVVWNSKRRIQVDYRRALQEYLDEETSVIQSLELDTINTVINVLERVRLSENNIFYMWQWRKCSHGKSLLL